MVEEEEGGGKKIQTSWHIFGGFRVVERDQSWFHTYVTFQAW